MSMLRSSVPIGASASTRERHADIANDSLEMPTITLTTDFGTRDGYVGAMKGVITKMAPRARIVDITHEVPAHDVFAGAFAIWQAARFFPKDTIHVVVVDPGVGSIRRSVALKSDGQWFVGPDNGVLTLVAPSPSAAYEIAHDGKVAPTFHGRDVFAPCAARLARGIRRVGRPTELFGTLTVPAVTERGAEIIGHVIHIDRFGNSITDIPRAALHPGALVSLGRLRLGISRTFADVPRRKPVAYIGSSETLELALREDSLAKRHGIRRGAPVRVRNPH